MLSAWSGIRPLVSDPNKPDTQSLARNHIVHISPSKLITIAGGKWTTYRSMAQDTLDAAIEGKFLVIGFVKKGKIFIFLCRIINRMIKHYLEFSVFIEGKRLLGGCEKKF